jgi:hypothetical protein
VHGIRVAEQNGHDTIVVAKSRVWLGAVQLIVAESNDGAWGKRTAETQASILLEDVLLNCDDVWDAICGHLERGTLHNNSAACANNTALVSRGRGKTNAGELATAECEHTLGSERAAITGVGGTGGGRVDLGILVDAAGAVAGRIGNA